MVVTDPKSRRSCNFEQVVPLRIAALSPLARLDADVRMVEQAGAIAANISSHIWNQMVTGVDCNSKAGALYRAPRLDRLVAAAVAARPTTPRDSVPPSLPDRQARCHRHGRGCVPFAGILPL